MISWLMESPSRVPSPAGFVVENGLNIFSRTSGGMPDAVVEQPGVFDSDDRLSGEVLHQSNLFVGECPDFPAIDGDLSDNFVILQLPA